MTRVRVYDDEVQSLLATIEAAEIHVVFPEPIDESAEKLLRALGVTWSFDTRAPVLGQTHDPNARGDRKTAHLRKNAGHRRRKKKV